MKRLPASRAIAGLLLLLCAAAAVGCAAPTVQISTPQRGGTVFAEAPLLIHVIDGEADFQALVGPMDAGRPLEVYVNGVAQEEGRDFEVSGRRLVFTRELRQEGRLGFWRWLSLFLGIAGTYRQNDSVDVVYDTGGRRTVTSLAIESPATRSPS